MAAGAVLLAGAPAARAASSSSREWLAYRERLTTGLQDAGGGRFDHDFARGLLVETNRFRSSHGLAALRWDDGLALSARAHVSDMIARRYFAHASPEGFTHIDRVSLLGRDLCAQTAENLAYRDNPSAPPSPQTFEAMWEASPGHRRNLADGAFAQAGYGVVRIGSAVYAAGVYGDVAVRLAKPLPMVFAGSAELAGAVAGASPQIERFALTAPFAQPTWMVSAKEALPSLARGVWQLRPLRGTQGSSYSVLPGPLFHIA